MKKIILLLVISYFNTFSQISFEHIINSDGLSNNVVRTIYQDSQGFLWIGTEDGLNKFDGYKFTVYRNDRHKENSLSDNFVYSIYEDSKGVLWVGTNSGGLNKFDPHSGSFKAYKNIPGDNSSISSNRIQAITEDKEGNIWVGTFFGGINKLNPDTEKFTRYISQPSNSNSLSDNNIFDLDFDSKGGLWIATESRGLNYFTPSSGKFIRYSPGLPEGNSISGWGINDLSIEGSSLWIATNNGVNRLDLNKMHFYSYNVDFGGADPNVNSIVSIDNKIWMATLSGLFVYDTKTGGTERYRQDPVNPNGLNNETLYRLFPDKTGAFWIGTLGGGLNKFNRNKKKFRHYRNDPGNPNSITSNTVRAIFLENEETLWISMPHAGVNKINRKTGYVEVLRNNGTGSIGDDFVTLIKKDSKGNLWFGTWSGGVSVMDKSGKFEYIRNIPGDDNSLMNNLVQAFYEDQFGNIWLGTENGISLYDPSAKNFRQFRHDPSNKNTITQNGVQSNTIVQDKNGHIWVATWGGLNQLIPQNSSENSMTVNYKIVRYNSNPENISSLSDDRVISIFYDRTFDSGKIYAGTYGGGLNIIDLDDALKNGSKTKIRNYTTADGLPNNVIYGILNDNEGNLWLSTNDGLSKFNPKSEEFKNYDANDGIQSNQFFWGSCFRSQSGYLFFGGINGFNEFLPSEIIDDQIKPEIIITSFQILNKEVGVNEEINGSIILSQSIDKTQEITLSYKENVFSFEFSALHFAYPKSNKYAYIMEGFDTDWNYVSSDKRFASYTNLNPGTYIFKVKGSNYDGVWNEEASEIRIEITPPFWATFWFRSFVIIIIAAIAYWFYLRAKNRRIFLEAKNKELQIQISRSEEAERKAMEETENAKEAHREAELSHQQIAEQTRYLETSAMEMREAINKFSQGDLTVRLSLKESEDDIAKLFWEFNEALSKVHQMIGNVKEAIDTTTEATRQITGHIRHIAQGAQEQMSYNMEVAGAVEEMTATIAMTADNAMTASTSANNAKILAVEGGRNVEETLQGMNNIADFVSSASADITMLGKSSEKINEIIEVINDIADQTNLLALNASIEAARAGEHGRGFAVVAEEVRKLAEKSAKSTSEISNMIKTIQTEITKIVSLMQKGEEEVRVKKLSVTKTSESITNILNSSNEVEMIINQVATATEEQSSAATDISQSLLKINSINDEFGRNIGNIAMETEKLNVLSDSLIEAVQGFKVD